jgi:Sec-independent protein secretion pathway component TatC
VLAIFILAAVITPSTDVFNLVLFATPMCGLFYLGVLASYLFTRRRDGRAGRRGIGGARDNAERAGIVPARRAKCPRYKLTRIP